MNLAGNQLCGLDEDGEGTYTTEGIQAIADALRVNGSVTDLNIAKNNLIGQTDYIKATEVQAEANVEKYRNAARHWKMQHDKLKAEASA